MAVKILFLFFFLPYTPKTYLHEVSFVYTSVEQTGTAVHESTLVMQLFSKSSEYQAWIISFRDNLVIEALKLVLKPSPPSPLIVLSPLRDFSLEWYSRPGGMMAQLCLELFWQCSLGMILMEWSWWNDIPVMLGIVPADCWAV